MDSVVMVSWIFAAVGIMFLGTAIWSVVAAQRQETWATVPGQVVRSQVEYRGEEFAAEVSYTYSYDGREYTGRTVSSPPIVYNWRGPAERICARYPEGAVVVTHVNPRDPQRSVLEPPGGIGSIAMLLVSILCLVFAWALNRMGH
jgi:hypothetical protein